MTIRNQIVAAIVAAISGAGIPADTVVFRHGTRKSDSPNQVRVFGSREDVERQPGETARVIATRRLTVVAELGVKRVGDVAPDDAQDALYAWVVRAVMADETLGGLAHQIAEQTWEIDQETLDQTYIRSAVGFEVLYDTDPQDPRALPGEPPLLEGD